MWKLISNMRALSVLMAAFVLSCSSEPESSVPDLPRQVDSGFVFLDDSFIFGNYGGSIAGPQLTPELVARMFGAENVCIGEGLPCELNPVALIWMGGVNGTLNEGRSEGFAITSLLFHAGVLDPRDFGADSVADLRLFGNRKLQEEFAYWAATQAVPSAVANDVRYQAKDVLPFLAEVLQPEVNRHYRLAIAQRTETGFARGHAVTPIGYYKGEGDIYWLRIYDNNFPEGEKRIEINPVANTWRYEVPALDGGEPILYEGTPENGNYLYFSAVQDRLGVLKAPFAPDSGVRTINYSTLTLVASNADGGMETGIRNGEILEAGEDRVMPAFSACPRCGARVSIVNQTLIDAGVQTRQVIDIQTEGDVRTSAGATGLWGRTREVTVGQEPGDGNMDWINATGPNFSTSVTVNGDVSNDSVTFGERGETTYTARSGNGVAISTGSNTDDGWHQGFSVNVEGSDDPNEAVTVRVTKGENGETIVEVENLPEGKNVEISVVYYDPNNPREGRTSDTVTFTSNGGTSRAVLDPEENRISVQNVGEVAGGHCDNGLFDPALETDVDCGGFCNGCSDGKLCETSDDCEAGTCVAQGGISICRASQCYDGVRNGDETDVDCGGTLCGPCSATVDQRTTPQCALDSDCNTGMCRDGRCRLKQPVKIRANRYPQGGVTIGYTLDGQYGSVRLQSNVLEGPHELVIGEAYTFQVETLQVCATDYSLQRTGLNSDDDQVLAGIIEVDCPEEGELTINAELRKQARLSAIPENDPITVELIIDGERSEFTLSGQEQTLAVGSFEDTWSARVIKEPLTPIVHPFSHRNDIGSYYCYAAPWLNSDKGVRNTTLIISCEWRETSTCSDGIRNQDESDVDCGGVCGPCALNQSCYSSSDCVANTFCVDGSCRFVGACDDGIQNQDETDIDCGGDACEPCGDLQSCLISSDCQSNNCEGGVCQVATCDDGIQNQDESDIDCGGVCPTKCPLGASCNVAGDCADADCINGICVESCLDGAQNQDETDIDCGGSICAGCAEGLSCLEDSDCASNYCFENTCAVASCSDSIQNQDETDVDCGGSICDPCADGLACLVSADCASNYCLGGVCTEATCSDGVQNQDETGIDCGGATCDPCSTGGSCDADSDCASNLCVNNLCAESCSDGIQNQDETDVDCGGSVCSPCTIGLSCTLDSDCASNNCECSANSGDCVDNSGQCGAAKAVIDMPTVDGSTVSGSFTVPAQCSQVYVQAWGAAGGAGSGGGGGGGFPGGPPGGTPGGAGGYVSGTLSVLQGDVIDVWIGQGGDFDVVADFGGTPGIGSKYGVLTSGGLGDGDDFLGGGGGGGGLTSVRITGSTSTSFLIPAGGGGTEFTMGDDVTFGSGGGALDSNGEDAPFGSGEAGGGAGEEGGAFLGLNGGGGAGTYGNYPPGFSTADGLDGTPANTSAPDYSLCEGIGEGEVGAGASELGSMWTAGGDGCVILRCVAP